MLKLALMAGMTLSALICGMMTLGSNGLFQNQNFGLINNIKEIFGLSPRTNQLSSNSQFYSTTGDSGSFSFGGGGYLPPKSVSEDNYNSTDLTTPLFRIFIASTSTTTTTAPITNSPSPITTVPSSTSTDIPNPASSTTTTTQPPTTSSSSTSFSTGIQPTNNPKFKEEALAEATTVSSSSLSSISPTPYAFQGNPSPQFKIDLIWSTLVPPAMVSTSENEVAMNENTKSASAGSGGSGVIPLPNNGLYLPPSKEYLPPNE